MDPFRIWVDLNDRSSYASFVSASRQAIPLLYEDNHLLVVVKPDGVLSQSDGSAAPDMLTLLKEYIKIKSGKPGDVFLGLVHRLDRPVSGVMVFAKTSKSASRLSEQIREKTVKKKYYAIVHGSPPLEEARLQARLSKAVGNIVSEDEEGKEAVLYYRLLETDRDRDLSLIEIALETGRSHQIRVQMAGQGNPILGDKKYGNPNELYKGEIALFSYSFQFKHPTKDIWMQVQVIPPFKQAWRGFSDCFENVWKELEGIGSGRTEIK